MTHSAPPPIRIGGAVVGIGNRAWIVAELSGNHLHDRPRAEALIDAAAEAGADAVKLQTYTPDSMTIRSDEIPFHIRGTSWAGRNLYELYDEASTPWEWHAPLFERARALGMDAFSTPFDDTAVDFLEELQVPVHKIASFEIVHLPLLRKVAATRKPVIISTGMSTLGEIDEAVRTLLNGGCPGVVLLKCTSAYPAKAADMNLRGIDTLRSAFRCNVGLSDHTLGHDAAIAATALGACVVEKHLTLARADGGPDASFSLEPDEFASLVRAIRQTEAALGDGVIRRTASEEESLVFRRSIFVVRDMVENDVFNADNVRVIRPGNGLAPRHLEEVLGRRASCALSRGTPLEWSMLK